MNLAKKGFTLIELLVVIAIIGILAAIILPVYAQARKSAYRSADMSNMNQLRTALQLYRSDQGGYPPALLGYVTQYAGGPNPTTTDMLPANMVQGALFPKRVDSLSTFTPAFDKAKYTDFTNPVWPAGEVGATVGDQGYGSDTHVEHCIYTELSPSYYYPISGYDVATVGVGATQKTELHYAPFWSYSTVPSTCNPSDATGNAGDDVHQLGYTDPPADTIITWDSAFRDYDSSGNPLHLKQDIVLFLGGDARPFDSLNMATQAWKAYTSSP